MTLYTIQFSLKSEFYAPERAGSTLVTIDVFASSSDDAVDIARHTLNQSHRYDIDDVTEN